MRRALYALLLAAMTSAWACDSRPVRGSIAADDGGGTDGGDNGNNGNNDQADLPPAGFTACTTDTWQSYAKTVVADNCVRCHSDMSDFVAVAHQSASFNSDVSRRTMPTDTTLPGPDISRLSRWVDCDLPP